MADVRRIETALGLITTGLAHRDRQIRDAILSELVAELLESLNAIASTVSQLGRRIREGLAYDMLLKLQTEAWAIFSRLDGAR